MNNDYFIALSTKLNIVPIDSILYESQCSVAILVSGNIVMANRKAKTILKSDSPNKASS